MGSTKDGNHLAKTASFKEIASELIFGIQFYVCSEYLL